MKKKACFVSALLLSCTVNSAEIANGAWSSDHTIEQVVSHWSYTKFKIDTSTGCGSVGEGWWRLPTSLTNETHDRALEYKKSILLMAFAAGNTVRLRCENNAISDFEVKN